MMHCVSVMRDVRLVLPGNIFDALGGDQEELGQTHFKNLHVDPLLKIIRTGRVVAQQLGPNIFQKVQQKTKNHAPPCVTWPRRPVGMS